MRLDRNERGTGKYALLKIRKLDELYKSENVDVKKIIRAIELLKSVGVLDYGETQQTEFFVIRLKDQFAFHALNAYAQEAIKVDFEYGSDVLRLADNSGLFHPFSRMPD